MQDRTRTHRPSPQHAAIRVELGRSLVGEAGLLARAAEGLCHRLQAEGGAAVQPPIFLAGPSLQANEYRIRYGDDEESRGRAWPGRLQARGDSERLRGLAGRRDTEPFFGQPCVWIPRQEAAVAQAIGVELLEASEVVVGHVERALRRHRARLTAFERVQDLLGQVERSEPDLVDRVSLRVGREPLQQVLCRLAAEGVPLGDLRLLLERLADWPGRPTSVDVWAERLRVELRESICRPLAHQGKLTCLTLDPDLQTWLFTWLHQGADLRAGEPWLTRLARDVREALDRLDRSGGKAALVCLPSLRPVLSRVLGLALPELQVLKTAELDPTLQVLDRVRLSAPGWRLQASRWWGYAWLGGDPKRRLKAELEEYDRSLRRRTLPARPTPEPAPGPPPRRPQPRLPELRKLQLTPLQKAAVLLLECPSWVLRELLARLAPAEVSRLGREMTRMGRQSQGLRERVLRELPGGARGPLEFGQLLAHLRGLLDEASRPETVLSEVGLCLSVLPDPLYHPVAGRVFAWLKMEAAEDLRAELAALRSQANPQRAARALERFARFRREGLQPTSLYGTELLGQELQRTARANPQALARALERLWLRPEAHRLEDFARWCEESPSRAARWLVRWARHWTPPEGEPEEQARLALDTLPVELADGVRRHLAAEVRELPRGEGARCTEGLVRQWLAEYYVHAWPDSPAAELCLN